MDVIDQIPEEYSQVAEYLVREEDAEIIQQLQGEYGVRQGIAHFLALSLTSKYPQEILRKQDLFLEQVGNVRMGLINVYKISKTTIGATDALKSTLLTAINSIGTHLYKDPITEDTVL